MKTITFTIPETNIVDISEAGAVYGVVSEAQRTINVQAFRNAARMSMERNGNAIGSGAVIGVSGYVEVNDTITNQYYDTNLIWVSMSIVGTVGCRSIIQATHGGDCIYYLPVGGPQFNPIDWKLDGTLMNWKIPPRAMTLKDLCINGTVRVTNSDSRKNFHFENLNISSLTGVGLILKNCYQGLLENVFVADCGSDGIQTEVCTNLQFNNVIAVRNKGIGMNLDTGTSKLNIHCEQNESYGLKLNGNNNIVNMHTERNHYDSNAPAPCYNVCNFDPWINGNNNVFTVLHTDTWRPRYSTARNLRTTRLTRDIVTGADQYPTFLFKFNEPIEGFKKPELSPIVKCCSRIEIDLPIDYWQNIISANFYPFKYDTELFEGDEVLLDVAISVDRPEYWTDQIPKSIPFTVNDNNRLSLGRINSKALDWNLSLIEGGPGVHRWRLYGTVQSSTTVEKLKILFLLDKHENGYSSPEMKYIIHNLSLAISRT